MQQLIALMYRFDWSTLCLSARVRNGSSSSTLLVAPGGRYREQDADGNVKGSDGERNWTKGHVDAPVVEQLKPSRLLTGHTLTVTDGPPVSVRATAPDHYIDVRLDPELGIPLRWTVVRNGRELADIELLDVRLDPPEAADDAQFAGPASHRGGQADHGTGWTVTKTAAGLAAGGLGSWIRLRAGTAPREPHRDPDVAMPAGQPFPRSDQPVPDDLLYLLYRGHADTPFSATWHTWSDVAWQLGRVPEGAREAGFGGVGKLSDTMGNLIQTTHRAATVHVGAGDEYRIDYVTARRGHRPSTIVSDGAHRWTVKGDGRISRGPARRMPSRLADLVDASRLLELPLYGGTPVAVDGRRGYVLTIGRDASWVLDPTEVIVDAELGVVLQASSYDGDRLVGRSELVDIGTEPVSPELFRIDAEDVYEESGNPLKDEYVTKPGATGAAVRAAVEAARLFGNLRRSSP
jgi:outer membrane lipoprotein-sorting protein